MNEFAVFVKRVKGLRALQHRYFAERTPELLARCKNAEWFVEENAFEMERSEHRAFARLVVEMLTAQRQYWKVRTEALFKKSRLLEKRVDVSVEELVKLGKWSGYE